MTEHWTKYGRNFYTRYDYEGVESKKADKVIQTLLKKQGEIAQARIPPPNSKGRNAAAQCNKFRRTESSLYIANLTLYSATVCFSLLMHASNHILSSH